MFEKPADKREKLRSWAEDQDRKVAERQGKSKAYYGACGGALTYEFTPTTLGLCIVVRNGVTGESINLTDYDNW